MDAQEILLQLQRENGVPADEAEKAARDLVASSTPAEQAAVIATLRRGASWSQARDWLERARFESASVDEAVFQRALEMYGGSLLLDWQECLDVAPALLYRPAGLPSGS
ncbi:hypothetical protein [Thalassiella azotivora]